MSHTSGEVRSVDGSLLGLFEYNGERALAPVRSNFDEIQLYWRTYNDYDRTCTCGNPPVPVTLSVHLDGPQWTSAICTTCRCITGDQGPYDAEDREMERLETRRFSRDGV